MKTRSIPYLLLLLLFSTTIFIACKKDKQIDTPTPSHPYSIPAASPVTGSVSGLIVDENNNPVPGAEIVLSGNIYASDSKGFFNINNVQLDKYISTVTVNKTGYFKAVRSFAATATGNYVSIKLIPKILLGTIDASAGGSLSLSNGTVLNFGGNSVVLKSSGAAYTGNVNIYASYIDPTTTDFSARVPGSMMGQDTENMYLLQSTGMLAAEIESASGEALQVTPGKAVAVKLPIPSSLTGKAPATINTWSLDDRGIWIKEGSASRSGDFYEMQVSHFSFWNCDAPSETVFLTIHIHDQNGNPLPNVLVHLTIPNNTTQWASTSGYTDSLGNVSGLVPANQSLLMEIFPNPYDCITPVASQTIGPFSSNASIDMPVTTNASQSVTVSGTANDCNNQPIQNGTAIINQAPYTELHTSIVNGIYSATILYCSNTVPITVTVVDLAATAQASSGNLTISGSSLSVPLLTACNAIPAAIYSCNGWSWYGPGTHNYYAGVTLNPTDNDLLTYADVQTAGTYNLSTGSFYGMDFSGSGVFTTTGNNQVRLTGSGAPEGAGEFAFELHPPLGQAVWIAYLTVQWPASVNTTYTMGTLGQPCTGAVIAGNYIAGTVLNAGNTVTIDVDVTVPGEYYIYTEILDGFYFSYHGQFTTTGAQTVVLSGHGTPATTGINTFEPRQHNLGQGCSFVVNVN